MLVREIRLADTRPLRQTVLRPHETLEELAAAEGPDAFAVGAFDRDQLIAVGYVLPEDGPGAWRVRGMATAQHLRGKGAGTLVLDALLRHALGRGATRVWCTVRTNARSLYERAGFRTTSEEFQLPDIGPHVVMELLPEAGAGPRPNPDSIAARLADVLGEALVGGLEQLSSGASRDSYRITVPSHGELVLQMERPGGARSGRPPQGALLSAAADAGVPVAQVIAEGTDDPVLGPSWIVVASLPGTTDPGKILGAAHAAGDDASRSGRAARLLDSIAGALAAVHRMPRDPALAGELALVSGAGDPLAALRGAYDRLRQPHPVFELAFRALAEGPPAGRRTFVHGDFRLGNLMVDGDAVTGVLDWELAHVGDPVEDLGWLCVPAWRFGRPDRPAAGLGSRAQLLDAYAAHAGIEVDPVALRWWEIAGTLRWGVICVMQAFTHLSGSVRSVEHAVIGRRACEVEWDLLQMLAPQRASRSRAGGEQGDRAGEDEVERERAREGDGEGGGADGLHDRPTAIELLDAARGALGDDVLPLLEGRASFQLRVSLRALGIVRRELAHADDHAVLRGRALNDLGVADEAALCEAIAAGAFDGDERLPGVLRALVRAKLEAANPRYLEGP